MNRRELFRFLPAGALAIPGLARAAEVPEKAAEPSPWIEWQCKARFGPEELWEDRTPCGTKFKSIRGVSPCCPKCGTHHCVADREQYAGIEVK